MAPVSCSSDSDCRVASDYCEQCSCKVIGKDGALPKCVGGKSVQCVMDPCRNKHAVCSAGKCALADGDKM
jgi:hypothetical protein